jgi:hypothetical protein
MISLSAKSLAVCLRSLCSAVSSKSIEYLLDDGWWREDYNR